MPIEPTLRELIELGCAGEGSGQGSHATASSHAKGLADGDGSSSEHLVGSIDFVVTPADLLFDVAEVGAGATRWRPCRPTGCGLTGPAPLHDKLVRAMDS
jgi:hypothetical protein